MTIREKTFLSLATTFVCLFVGLVWTSHLLILDEFDRLEVQSTVDSLRRVHAELGDQLRGLEATANDWAAWDDTYEYARGNNPSYEDENLTEEVFANLQLEVMVLTDTAGEVLYAAEYSVDLGTSRPLSEAVLTSLIDDYQLWRHDNEESTHSGHVLLAEGPMTLVSHPILNNDGSGPIQGAMIIGRYLGPRETSRISGKTQTRMVVHRVDAIGQNSALAQGIFTRLSHEDDHLTEIHEGNISGFELLHGVRGEPTVVLQVETPRTLHFHGMRVFRYAILWLLAVALASFGTIFVLMEKTILNRLARLGAKVDSLGAGDDVVPRIEMSGSDELARLASSISSMISSKEIQTAKLKESEHRYRTLFERAGDPMFIYCPADQCCTEINAVALAMLGYEREELLMMPPEEWCDTLPEDVSCNDTPAADSQAPRVYQTSLLRKDGTDVPVEIRATPIHYAGKPAVVCAARDLTERKQEEAHRTQLEKQMRQAQKMQALGTLSAGIAHEINNPMGHLSWSLEHLSQHFETLSTCYLQSREAASAALAGDKAADAALRGVMAAWQEKDIDFVFEDSQTILAECADSAGVVKDIIHDLRSFSHPELASLQDTDLHAVLDSAINLTSNQLKYTCEVVREFGELPSILVYPQRLTQVFMNLMVNAAQAMSERGTLTVTTGLVDEITVQVTIMDTGKGIAPDDLNKIFDPFFTTKPVGEGTGLGLHVVASIIEDHGGHIWAESHLGKGSSFHLRLPVNPSTIATSYGITEVQSTRVGTFS